MLFAASFRHRASLSGEDAALPSQARAPSRSNRPKAGSANIQVVSQLLAGTRSGPGRSSDAARVLMPRARARGRRTSSRCRNASRWRPSSGRGENRIIALRSAGTRRGLGSVVLRVLGSSCPAMGRASTISQTVLVDGRDKPGHSQLIRGMVLVSIMIGCAVRGCTRGFRMAPETYKIKIYYPTPSRLRQRR